MIRLGLLMERTGILRHFWVLLLVEASTIVLMLIARHTIMLLRQLMELLFPGRVAMVTITMERLGMLIVVSKTFIKFPVVVMGPEVGVRVVESGLCVLVRCFVDDSLTTRSMHNWGTMRLMFVFIMDDCCDFRKLGSVRNLMTLVEIKNVFAIFVVDFERLVDGMFVVVNRLDVVLVVEVMVQLMER